MGWLPWALGSAAFAALTAIWAKVGLEGVNSDFATLFRTGVILVVLSAVVALTGAWVDPRTLSGRDSPRRLRLGDQGRSLSTFSRETETLTG